MLPYSHYRLLTRKTDSGQKKLGDWAGDWFVVSQLPFPGSSLSTLTPDNGITQVPDWWGVFSGSTDKME